MVKTTWEIRLGRFPILAKPSDQGLASLQCARAIAALTIVFYHCAQAIEARTGLSLKSYTNFGASGVDVFFVISGLIMTMSTRQAVPFSFGDFIMRRIIRIVPIYWVYTLLKSGILLTDPAASLFSQFSMGHLIASLFFIPVMEPRGIYPILVVGWTLNCEALFYVLFGASKAIWPSRWIMLLVTALVGLAASHFLIRDWYAAAVLWTDPIILEFAFGVGLAELYHAGLRPSVGLTAGMVLTGALGLGLLPEVPGWRLFLWGIPAALLVFGILSADRLLPFRRLRLMMEIGDSSYSLYLTHTLVIPVFAALSLRVTVLAGAGVAWTLIPMTLGCVFIGWFSYILLELPLTRGIQAAWRRQRAHADAPLVSAPNAR